MSKSTLKRRIRTVAEYRNDNPAGNHIDKNPHLTGFGTPVLDETPVLEFSHIGLLADFPLIVAAVAANIDRTGETPDPDDIQKITKSEFRRAVASLLARKTENRERAESYVKNVLGSAFYHNGLYNSAYRSDTETVETKPETETVETKPAKTAPVKSGRTSNKS